MNPHPPLTGFPFVLVALLWALELWALIRPQHNVRPVRFFLLTALIVASPLTYYSGYFGADYANQAFIVPEQHISEHQALAQGFLLSLVPLAALGFIVASAERPLAVRGLYWLAISVAMFLVVATSMKGGDLVFVHGAGVQQLPQ